ncbi:unnamed protein product [Somion occarium]|uniref:HSF-type DNA-binding domain-containing protein n=1 Tax=Somion occarium TaxID=3059160 RepID=A0ABP1E3P3_9APHY
MDPTASHYSHPMPSGGDHYSSQQQQSQQQQSQWSATPHLLPPTHNQSSFPSPSSPSTSLGDHHYPPFYSQSQQQAPGQSGLNDGGMVDRSSTALSLNLSSLSVTSPTNLSPIHPSPHPGSHMSPLTPISPSNAQLHHQNALSPHHHHHHAHIHQQQPFQFTPPEHGGGGVRYDDPQYEPYGSTRRLTSSRSSSSSEKSVPRKRSFTTTGGTPLPNAVNEENAPTPVSGNYDHAGSNMDTSPYDEVDMNYGGLDAEGSPVDGSTSGGEQDDQAKAMEGQVPSNASATPTIPGQVNVLGKPLGTNNFVTKLYQMINDPKSAQFISWTELGTSFVVSNVGEFSRTILGSHFKHNNFSSFVRQLNMYGFHKINRTPRAQRTSTDVQTWEFSHHKFLRGRPDLLEEIKRKALEPDPSIKHRVELPGEVAAQLTQMRDENRRLVHAVNTERNKVDRLVNITKALYDVFSKTFPGALPPNFPQDLLDSNDSPNILVTSPTNPLPHQHHSHYPSLGSLSSNPSLHSLHSLSPSSSPTAAEFPSHTHTPNTLSRQQSYQHMPPTYEMHPHGHMPHGVSTASAKRQRTAPNSATDETGASANNLVSKKGSRARSDSAPLGYGFGGQWQQANRPRSGSGLGARALGRREESVTNIGALSRGALPMLSIPGAKQGSS